MVKRLSVLVFGVLLLFSVLSGCSDETVVPTDNTQNTLTTLVEGDIDPNGGDFEYIVASAGIGTDQPGPFAIRGTNIHYVDSLSALSVDFTVENQGTVAHPEPVTLTFVQLLPDSVTVENPDNDEHGPGAMVQFQFENDDDMWTPDEISFPRTVLFGVGEGVSIGFVARIDVGMDETGGSIGGMVWHDVNEDGVMDDGEAGVGGVEIRLSMGDVPQTAASPIETWRTFTANDGTYRFDGLEAGHYSVAKIPNPAYRPTTPTVIEVILVESGGEVSDFLLANFGCVVLMEPDRIEVGDWVAVNGDYAGDPDRILARGISVVHCNVAPPPPDTMPDPTAGLTGDGDWDNDHDWDGCNRCEDWGCWGLKNELRGPVTDVNRDDHALEIMGTWVHFAMLRDSVPNDTIPNDTIPSVAYGGGDRDDDKDWDKPEWKWLHPDSVEVGDRVRVRVIRWGAEEKLYGFFLKEWNGTPEKVFGRVQAVSGDSGPVDSITVLGLDVIINSETEIHYKR